MTGATVFVVNVGEIVVTGVAVVGATTVVGANTAVGETTGEVAIGVVAALGVVMALLISVLQRRRELGLLRAVGATQGQVLYTVLAEATFMGILGTLLGVLAGVPLEWYLLRVVIYEESGYLFPVTIPWTEALVLSTIAIGTATVAGFFPAIHAIRLRIAEAIAYE